MEYVLNSDVNTATTPDQQGTGEAKAYRRMRGVKGEFAPKMRENIFSGKYHANSGILIIFSYLYFPAKKYS